MLGASIATFAVENYEALELHLALRITVLFFVEEVTSTSNLLRKKQDKMAAENERNNGLSCVQILPRVQNYGWGKKGSASMVAKMAVNPNEVDESKRYAEMWMGTHEKAPCLLVAGAGEGGNSYDMVNKSNNDEAKKVSKDGTASRSPQAEPVSLLDFIRRDPVYWLGANPTPAVAENDLPYLFKVLSFNQASSIQVHPDRTLAKKLHAEQPSVYDANHKPEIGIPISEEFECLCGFRPRKEILGFIESIPELLTVMKSNGYYKNCNHDDDTCSGADDQAKEKTSTVESLYKILMTADPDLVKEEVEKLVASVLEEDHNRNSSQGKTKIPEELQSVVKNLAEFYPGDVGIFSVFFLNYVKITDNAVGKNFVFCAANVPHTYLSGDVIECMSLSDNVVRAGLTPKFKDVPLLLSMCDFRDDIMKCKNVGVWKNADLSCIFSMPHECMRSGMQDLA